MLQDHADARKTAVIKEGLRLSVVIPGRLPRTVPTDGVSYKGIFIPGGVSYFGPLKLLVLVTTSSTLTLTNNAERRI